VLTFRPISQDWRGERTPPRERRRAPFRATYTQTLRLLDRELRQLGAERVVIQLDVTERDIRLDGLPRSNARPWTPKVILSFQSRFGPLRYQTDTFTAWTDNLRAIALGLEALRKVDRYGITRRGEQYAGWRALPPGDGDLAGQGERIVRDEYGGDLRRALMDTHPDRGGTADRFRAVQAYRERAL
jgi:hypothetical protein